MRCPFCGNVDTQVKDSRPAEDHVAIRRRRFCPACGGRFTTYERVQLRDLVVIKSNGRREDFDRTKLERSIRIALQKRPVEPERMDQMISGIVRRLEAWGIQISPPPLSVRLSWSLWRGSIRSPLSVLPVSIRISKLQMISTNLSPSCGQTCRPRSERFKRRTLYGVGPKFGPARSGLRLA